MQLSRQDIEKLSRHEKLQLIELLLGSLEDNTQPIPSSEDEITQLLQERIAKYEKGDMKFEDAKKVLNRLREKIRTKD